MTTELEMLIYALLLFVVTILIQVLNGIRVYGMKAMSGTREDIPAVPPVFQGRVNRTITNQIESLILFAPAVLVADAIGLSTAVTVLGAQLYLAGRVVHAAAYMFGINHVRTLAFAVAMVGTLMIIGAILGVI
ncbi:MAG: MAPEG family protein [Alphaproteobacteria bacterium]|nr:MAG: MAPEG family protein [Alphaproteobacteria bacterium]